MAQPEKKVQLLTRGEMLELVGGVSYVAVWQWIKQGKFPAGRAIGGGRNGPVMWLEDEVLDWIMAQPKRIPGSRPKKPPD